MTATSVGSGTTTDTEFPTLQFAESVKSFVSKCQGLNISSEEYRLMKLIALFQSACELCFLNLVFVASLKISPLRGFLCIMLLEFLRANSTFFIKILPKQQCLMFGNLTLLWHFELAKVKPS